MKDLAKGVVYAGLFLIPTIVLIISNTMFFPFITGKNFTFRVLVEIVFAAWIILALYDVQYRPRFSWILGSFSALLAIMFVANISGQHPLQSFWNNFERMEGYVTLVHAYAYFLVLGSVMVTEKLWHRYFMTIIGVSIAVALYAFAQLSGDITINQGGLRLDGTLGNSAYMAIYTLFLIFIGFLMFFKAKSTAARIGYAAFIVLFMYLLVQTATRGTTLGLAIGSLIMMIYIACTAKQYPQMRTLAVGGVALIVFVTGLFITFKDSQFIKSNPYLDRIATISLKEGTNRFNIWGMALEGVQERPILGWGQSNYNYVFNKYYKPELHGQEAWFDRVHNIVIDWLVAGGVLGALAYFSIMASAVYYIFLRPILQNDERFSSVERGVLIGLLAGYLIHNFFVFDNIVSYMFYAVILGYIHARVGTPIPRLVNAKIPRGMIEQIYAPVVALTMVVVVYMVNVPGILAAQDIIDAFRTNNPEEQLKAFDRALSRGSFGNQEIREQMTQRAQAVLQDEKVAPEVKEKFRARVEEELLKQIEEKPGDARVHVFVASFYRMSGQPGKAAEELKRARELSPQKQMIIFEQGYTELQQQNTEKALEFFKEAYELNEQLMEPRILYAMAAIYAGRQDLVDSLIVSDDERRSFNDSDQVLRAFYSAGQREKVVEIFRTRIEYAPDNIQYRTNLAYILSEIGKKDEAIAVLRQAALDIPSFKDQAENFIKGLEAPAPTAPQR